MTIVKKNHLPSVLLAIAMLSPLFVASCTSQPSQGMPQGLTSKSCRGCLYFTVKAWFFTPSHTGGLEAVLQSLPEVSPSLLDEGEMLRVISPSHDGALPARFRKHGKLDLIAEISSVTSPLQPIPVSLTGSSDEFNLVLTPGPASDNSLARSVSYDIGANLPTGKKAVYNSGHILLRNGESLLLLQHVNDEYVVWLVRVDFPD